MANNGSEPMQIDFMDDDPPLLSAQNTVVEKTNLDLESYASNYKGYGRILRLIYVADHCPALRIEALKMAINYVMETLNVNLYIQLHKKLAEAAASANLPDVTELPRQDPAWIDTRAKWANVKTEKLDADLKNFKTNSVKESIRRGYDDLGDHHLDCGDLSNALRCYTRSRDYCMYSAQMVNMCENAIKISIYLQNWTHVIGFLCKIEGVTDVFEVKDTSSATFTRLRCAAGLADMNCKRYKAAARNFLSANADLCEYSDVLSAGNVATYGGLCALATYDRKELREQVLGSSSFKLFLELEPNIRDMIHKFYDCRYAACFNLMNEIRDILELDIFMAPHVNELYSCIRNRALIQYFTPFMAADMTIMATAFNTTFEELENELIPLISEKSIQARIDSHNKVLYAKEPFDRMTAFQRALTLGRSYVKRTNMVVLKTAMIKHHIFIKD